MPVITKWSKELLDYTLGNTHQYRGKMMKHGNGEGMEEEDGPLKTQQHQVSLKLHTVVFL